MIVATPDGADCPPRRIASDNQKQLRGKHTMTETLTIIGSGPAAWTAAVYAAPARNLRPLVL